LPNRLLLLDRFHQAVARAEREGGQVALLFLDLDSFKTINDSLGHAVGDAMLIGVAERLAQCVRGGDTISRQGGDEFMIVLSGLLGRDAITPVLRMIRERLQTVFDLDGHKLTTSASIGVSIYPVDGKDFETLLKKADTAMYRAKEGGNEHYRFFDEQMNTEAVEHLRMKNGMRQAIERDEFSLFYQPQIELLTGAVVGVEALIRWNDPERGMISPAKFIPVTESSELIVPIGEWVIQEACRQAVVWRKAGLPPLVMAVNLSAVQFRRGDVEKTVMHALKTSGLEPRYLELELTESVLIHDTELVLSTVQRLKRLGVTLSIDDFGTGYSSLSYLKRFEVDKLKIDQSFIRDLATNADDVAIVCAIIQMAKSLNLKTIAEGVETEDLVTPLQMFGCDEAQGYHFAAPMTAPEFARFHATWASRQLEELGGT
jgi:diguanylate cyclase (GGDEF)-like protein